MALSRLGIAADWLEKGLAALPGSARLHMEMGKLEQRWGFYDDAAREFAIARSIDPGLAQEVDAALEDNERARRGRQTLVLTIPANSSTIQADVTVNGRASFPFIIDTGATYTSISQEMAEGIGYRLGPHLEQVLIATANGTVAAPVVVLESLDLHGYAVRNVKAVVLPRKAQTGVGLLGLNFLNQFRYSVDPDRHEFRLESR